MSASTFWNSSQGPSAESKGENELETHRPNPGPLPSPPPWQAPSEPPEPPGAITKSTFLNQACEQFLSRLHGGASLDADEFCTSFPGATASLRRLIGLRRFIQDHKSDLGTPGPARWPRPGENLCGFRLERELGRGAFARVYLALQTEVGDRRVVVKCSAEGAPEGQTLGRINHPNVIPVYSFRRDPETGLTVLCMPYLGNATLCDVLDRVISHGGRVRDAATILEAIGNAGAGLEPPERVPPPSRVFRTGSYADGIVEIAVQIADALAYLHRQGIRHLDLKPSNVLLTPDGRPVLLDFNLSFDRETAGRRSGGTVAYMAPEQLEALGQEGKHAWPDVSWDFYALGVLLYEVLTGVHPFGPLPLTLGGDELRPLLLARQRAGFRPLRRANPQVGKRRADVVERCLAHEPEQRPQLAGPLADDLRRSYDGVGRQLRRWACRHRRAGFGCCLIGFVVLLGLGLAKVHDARMQAKRCRIEWDLALAAYKGRDYQGAVDHLTRVIDERPSAPALFARGRTFQRLGRWDDALADFQKADKIARDGKTLAAIGYCLNKQEPWRRMQSWYLEAIKEGYARAAVHNNLGLVHLNCPVFNRDADAEPGQRGPLNSWRQAKKHLNRAIELDDRLQAAFYNRARLDFKWMSWEPQHTPHAGLHDLRRAIAIGPATVPLHRLGADLCAKVAWTERLFLGVEMPALSTAPGGHLTVLCAVAGNQDRTWTAEALYHVRRVVELGDPLCIDQTYRVLKVEPGFQELYERGPSKECAPEGCWFVDPIDDDQWMDRLAP